MKTQWEQGFDVAEKIYLEEMKKMEKNSKEMIQKLIIKQDKMIDEITKNTTIIVNVLLEESVKEMKEAMNNAIKSIVATEEIKKTRVKETRAKIDNVILV